MSALHEAAQLALEALEYGQHSLKQVSEYQWESRGQLAIDALKAALAQPEPAQEPDKCRVMVCGVDCHPGDQHCNGYCAGKTDDPPEATAEQAQAFATKQNRERPSCDECGKSKVDGWALYCVECSEKAFAPPQRPPLPKHDQHCVDVPGYGLMAVRLVRAVERAHGIGEPVKAHPEPAQQPVACGVTRLHIEAHRLIVDRLIAGEDYDTVLTDMGLSDAPPQRPPLTDEEMRKLWSQYGYKSALCMRFARAVERKVRGEE